MARHRLQVGQAVLLGLPQVDQHAARRADAGGHFVTTEALERQHLEMIEQGLVRLVVDEGPLLEPADGDIGITRFEKRLGLLRPVVGHDRLGGVEAAQLAEQVVLA